MKFVRNILKTGIIYFTAMYLGIGGYALLDYKISHSKTIKEKTRNTLIVKNYNLNLEGKIKHLTILGETHIYNSKESEFAEKFIDNFDYVACEGGGSEGALLWIFFESYYVAMKFYSLGTGRYLMNTTMDFWAKKKGKTIYYLEQGKDSYKNSLDLGQKLTLMGVGLFSLTIGHLFYFVGKQDLETESYASLDYYYLDDDSYLDWVTGLDEDWSNWSVNLKERNSIIVKNILKIFKKDEVGSLLCIMGSAHVPGVLKKLKAQVELKIDNPKRL